MIIMREHLVRAYKVGAKKSNSLSIVIPTEIVKKYRIDSSTLFVVECYNNGIFFSYADVNKKTLIPIHESLGHSSE